MADRPVAASKTEQPQPSAAQARATTAAPKYWHVLLIALIASVFTALWLGIYRFLNTAIWSNSFVTTHRWVTPVAVVVLSALVGLCVKYLRAPTVIHGTAMESLKGNGQDKVDYTNFPGALLSSFLSVLSGASVGPEGPLGILMQDIAAWIHEKLKLAQNTWLGFESASFASMYNGIIGNPLFTGVLATEYNVGAGARMTFLVWNLLAGVIGFLFFTLLKLPVFAQYIPFTPISHITLEYVVFAILLSLIGCLVAIFIGVSFRVFEALTERVFGERVVLRAVSVGAIIGVIGYFVPAVLFAGETQIFPMVRNPASFGVWALLGLGILKLLLFALSFKSGYLGGPTFPILFGCTMFGLALSLLFPGIPVSIFVLSIEVAALTFATGAPLTMILLVAVIGTADLSTIALLTLSSVVALMVSQAFKRLMAQRQAQREARRVRPANA